MNALADETIKLCGLDPVEWKHSRLSITVEQPKEEVLVNKEVAVDTSVTTNTVE